MLAGLSEGMIEIEILYIITTRTILAQKGRNETLTTGETGPRKIFDREAGSPGQGQGHSTGEHLFRAHDAAGHRLRADLEHDGTVSQKQKSNGQD